MNTHSVNNTVKQFIMRHFSHARTRLLTDDDPLLESGIVDSLGVLDIVSFIESDLGVIVDDEDLVRENFGSIRRIATYIENKQKNMARV